MLPRIDKERNVNAMTADNLKQIIAQNKEDRLKREDNIKKSILQMERKIIVIEKKLLDQSVTPKHTIQHHKEQ